MDKLGPLRTRHAMLLAWREAIQSAHRSGEAPPESNRKACQRHWEAFQKEVNGLLQPVLHRKDRLLREQSALLEEAAAGKQDASTLNARNRGLLLAIETAQEEIDALTLLTTATPAQETSVMPPCALEDFPAQYRKCCGSAWNRLTRLDRISLSVALTAVLLSAAYAFLVHDFGKRPQFQIDPPEGAARRVVIHCTNPYSKDLTLHVPWSSTGPGSGERNRLHTGIEVHARMKGAVDFKKWDTPPDVWIYEGQSTANRDPIEVPPGITVQVFFELSRLDAESLNLEAIALQCTTGSGHLLHRQEIAL